MSEQSLYEKRRVPRNAFDRTRTSLNKFSESNPPTTLQLKDLEACLLKNWTAFQAIHDEVCIFLEAEEKVPSELKAKIVQAEAVYEEVYEQYYTYRGKIEELVRQFLRDDAPTKTDLFSRRLQIQLDRFQHISVYAESEVPEGARSQAEVGRYLSDTQEMIIETKRLETEAVECLPPIEFTSFQKSARELYHKLTKLESCLIGLKVDLNTSSSSESSQASNNRANGVKVRFPMLEVPSFSGDILGWKSFSDLFTAAIGHSDDLSGAQKLQFLQRSVEKGDAKKVISHLPIQDRNFAIAWELLVSRYEDPREAIHNLMKKLSDQAKMNSESYDGLRNLLDTTNSCLRELKSYQVEVEGWNAYLVYLVTSRLDRKTRELWLSSCPGTQWPEFDILMSFLESRTKTLSQLDGSAKKPDDKAKRGNSKGKSTVSVHHTEKGNCLLCSESHSLTQCEKWKKATIEERTSTIRKKHLCWRCLSSGHTTKDCKSKNCHKCQGNHSNWICSQDPRNIRSTSSSHSPSNQQEPRTKPSERKENSDGKTLYHCHGGRRTVLMETCVVRIRGADSSNYLGRVFLDGGAEADFILRESADTLQLPRTLTQTTIVGIGDHPVGVSSQIMKLTLRSKYDDSAVDVNALIVDKLTNNLPRKEVDPSQWPELASLPLADPNFHEPNKINIILGAGTCAKIKRAGLVSLGKNGPTAQETIFGYVLQGDVESSPTSSDDDPADSVRSNHVMLAYGSLKDLESDVKRLYELEDGPKSTSRSAEQLLCEQHFVDNYHRDSDGRYVVKLPFRDTDAVLGHSRESARVQFLRLEKKLSKDPGNLRKYNDIFEEYLECGYLEPVPDEEVEMADQDCFYLPHHAVKKESSSTTKIRPVFNASAKSSSGYSLNDLLMEGPNIQDDIVPLMIRFGKHAVPLKADARQWYLQFRVHPEHVNFQRIFWRSNPTQPLRIWRFLVVVFGEGPAAFLAQRCQQQLCLDEKKSFPAAAQVLMEDCYRDDLVSGAANTTAAIVLHKEIVGLLARGGLEMRKWASSDAKFLKSLPPENCEFSPFEFDNDVTVKTLGIIWHAKGDYYSFKVRAIPEDLIWTKRSLLSDNARVYDPLGWLSPVTINARISMQKSWTVQELDWDAELPAELLTPFLKYRAKLHEVEKLQLSRRIFDDDVSSVQLCGFCDASSDAYAAVIYVRSKSSVGVKIKLVYAKAKVAPLSAQSINRLELEGALLLAQNLKSVREALKLDDIPMYAWTDSSVVLCWIDKESSSLPVFERNRVAKIQRILPRAYWRHVKGTDNPADCASRGIKVEDLLDHPLWWNGPNWLASDNYLDSEDDLEVNLANSRVFITLSQPAVRWKMLERVSTLSRLQRATVVLFRAIRKFKGLPVDVTLPYSPSELEAALNFWSKFVQSEVFVNEIRDLSKGNVVSERSSLKSLAPFLDDGMIRVGGRLQNSTLARDTRHPIVLPSRHKFTLLLVQSYHQDTRHGGRQMMESLLRLKFYIVKPGNIYKDVVKNCVVCDKLSNHPESQFMSPLPASRVTPTLPFERSGVDYAGPFMVKNILGRKVEHVKAYVVVFVCFSTKAVHLELVTNASTDNFIGALKRFVSTRGYPAALYSDQGTNFEGANNKLQSWLKLLKKEGCNKAFQDELELSGIKWNFNPPGAPHFGGLWEAAVNSMKHHLKRVTLGRVLSYETLGTLLKQIEACLNSRPLTAVSDDPNDLAALTPGHFLIGRPLLAIPEPDLAHLRENQLDQWQTAQKMFQEFWTRWTMEYLPRLQHRGKWHSIREEAEVGDLVRVVDENQPPLKWKLGRIVHLHPSKDKLNRVATIKIPYSNLPELRKCKNLINADDIVVKTTELVRPLVKLCLLPKIDTE